MISLIVHLVITILAVWYFTRPIREKRDSNEDPLEILKSRFAKGELTEVEFMEHKASLRNGTIEK